MRTAVLSHAAASSDVFAAAVAGMHVELWALNLAMAGAVEMTIDDTADTVLMGIVKFAAAGLWNPKGNGVPLCVSPDDLGMQMTLDDTVLTAGSVTWRYVTND